MSNVNLDENRQEEKKRKGARFSWKPAADPYKSKRNAFPPSVTKRGTLYSPEEKATKNEIYEHGCWGRRRDSEDMPTRYREWTRLDRLAITLMCMYKEGRLQNYP